MVIIRLRGGLGNQLFQYAAGKALAMHLNVELKLDLYTYERHPYRKFELSKFLIDAKVASRSEVHQFTGRNPLIRYFNKKENYFHCPRVFTQPHYHFVEDFFLLPSDIYLSGYWQSEKYFELIKTVIREQFKSRIPLDEVNKLAKHKFASEESVSIHVRRGDYSSNAFNSFFGTLEIEYYRSAITKIKSMCSSPVFYFFSDDPDWCKENFKDTSAGFITHNKGANSYKDLLLMSSCKHNIIANSTFSWWGAWLNDNPMKVIIAPQQWFRLNYLDKKEPVYASRLYNTRDLIPEKWLKI